MGPLWHLNYLMVIGEKGYSFPYNYGSEKGIDAEERTFHGKNIQNSILNCTKNKWLVFDFDLKCRDSLYSNPGDLILKFNFYDSDIGDTVYVFSDNYMQYLRCDNVIASKKFGIIGFYRVYYASKKEKLISLNYGKTYLDKLDKSYKFDTYKQKFPFIKVKPNLDLSKMGCLDRD
ncbi:MAG: hypothetical protein CFE24_13630 [Flavobacterium sp. BFFFF2]|nr:MAG: hypothetical protein CFE24_13630 [Flavobacterium sp. BFFFF2]